MIVICLYSFFCLKILAKKKRGRPKKPTDQDYLPPAGQNEEVVKGKPVKRVVNKIDQANAVEGLLELSNTGFKFVHLYLSGFLLVGP